MENTQQQLQELVQNIWWSWHPETLSLFEQLNPDAFKASGNNPVIALRVAKTDVLSDAKFQKAVAKQYEAFQAYMARKAPADFPNVAYYCMEYGLHESLALYSGGLGILAGDHTKAASDVTLPFTAIGLFLREGYFSQTFQQDGYQQQHYSLVNPDDLPVSLVTNADGTPLLVTVDIGDQPLQVQAWRLNIGHTVMYLLDTDVEGNPDELRLLTHRLYAGGSDTRIKQEVVLGIGGTRLIRALGLQPEVFHMNEGHCAFLTYELLREYLHAGVPLHEAEEKVALQCVFTTHTPVEAGHDRFDPMLTVKTLYKMRDALGMDNAKFLSYGRMEGDSAESMFNMTFLGFKLSRAKNGVARLNGILSRQMWKDLWGYENEDDVPITHITNGVHLGTWAAPLAQTFLADKVGNWQDDASHDGFWDKISKIQGKTLWKYRNDLKQKLIDYVNAKVPSQSIHQEVALKADVLTVGFARRFATYKRATLLFSDLDRLIRIVNHPERPVQFVFAGKAHPADEPGKALIKRIYELTQHPQLKGKVVFLENYNMEVGRALISGVDVWLNNPRRPMEASGTSGQKVALHGGLNLSILDGWWPEGYNGANGWAIGADDSAEVRTDIEAQDAEDAQYLYDLLEGEVTQAYYTRDKNGVPTQWVEKMKNAMQSLIYSFSAERMVRDYVERIYKFNR